MLCYAAAMLTELTKVWAVVGGVNRGLCVCGVLDELQEDLVAEFEA